ncbi:hypothetical protein FRB96_004921 [Tulasnella sp. 330]|nr:hypothetical protein FRB96_004921 [Tulasnella sp. 330]
MTIKIQPPNRFLTLAAALSCIIQAIVVIAVHLPTALNATFAVGGNVFKLVDDSRVDPFNTTENRAVEITVYYPSAPQDNGSCPDGTTFAPYVPSPMASLEDAGLGVPQGTAESTITDTCLGAPPISSARRKLILSSPELGGSRLLYQTITSPLAANGYVVISIDHPYDAGIVEYPDGELVFAAKANQSGVTTVAQLIDIRTKDVQFVLDEVCGGTNLTQGISVDCGIRKVGIFGHSLGGARAADMTIIDQRIAGGVNLDGTFFPTETGPYVSPYTPFLLFASQGHNATSDPSFGSWYETTEKDPAPRVMATVQGAQHEAFTDLPVLLNLLGISDAALPAATVAELGTIDGDRLSGILQVYLKAWFDLILMGEAGSGWCGLVGSGNRTFPELDVVLKKSN